MMNYHELTMTESRDSPQRHKQFLVICSIMTVMCVHGAFSAGIFHPTSNVEIDDFHGGDFVYKYMTKDYAASFGTQRQIDEDLESIAEETSDDDAATFDDGDDDVMYSMFLDDEHLVPGGKTRYMGGIMLRKKNDGRKRALLGRNEKIAANFYNDGGSGKMHSKNVQYEAGKLPTVLAVVLRHPFSGGAWSAVLQSWKIIPAVRKAAERYHEQERERNPSKGKKTKKEQVVVIATCSDEQRMCSFYAPLTDVDKFYLGKPDSINYTATFEGTSWLASWGIDFSNGPLASSGMSLGKVGRGLKKLVGLGGAKKNTKEEL